jgi:hypothetical protein
MVRLGVDAFCDQGRSAPASALFMHSLRSIAPRATRLLGTLALLLTARAAHGQAAAAPAPTPAEAPAPAEPAAADDKEAKPPPTELELLRLDLDATKKELADVKAAQEEAAAALPEDASAEQEKLKIYGFADMGFQYVQIDKSSILANVYDVNNPDFILGNVNLYFDAQPVDNWRALVEVRFTNAPQGKITNFGGLGGQFTRSSTASDDSSGAALNAPLWGGSVIIERAWLEYNRFQAVKLRVGNWFTPFGIWNEDHGTPTLISLAWPQFMTQRWMPLRQTGLMAYGSTFAGSWELGYAATLSNGRQEDANLNIDGTLGFGGRAYARRDTGSVNSTLGVSFFSGKSRNRVVSVTGVDPISFRAESTYEYQEYVVGADASLDIGSTRIRSEGVVRRLTYTPGKREPLNQVLEPGGSTPDKWEHSVYLLVAQQLPGALDMLEPYVWAEAFQTPTIVGDGTFVGSVGLNVRFNPAITWKNQFAHVEFFDWMYDSPYDNSKNNINQFYSRLVMAF